MLKSWIIDLYDQGGMVCINWHCHAFLSNFAQYVHVSSCRLARGNCLIKVWYHELQHISSDISLSDHQTTEYIWLSFNFVEHTKFIVSR